MNIFIVGYYGFKNTGDELILSKIIDDIKTIDNNADIAVWSADVKYTSTLHKVKAVNRFSVEETAYSVKWSDVVIVGGGGLIQEYFDLKIEDMFKNFGHSLAAYAISPLIASVYEKPVFYWSHGIGPIFSDEAKQFSNWFYSFADCTTVRDDYSYGLIKSIRPQIKNLYLDADPVVKLDISKFVEKEKFKLQKDKLKIGINLRSWFGQTDVVEKIAAALNRFIKERDDAIVVPVPFDLSFDVEILKKLLSNLPEDRVEQRYIDNIESPTDVLTLMNNVDIFIGTRLHSIIVANLLEKPSVAVIYDKKVESFIERLSIPSVFIGTLDSFNVYTLIKELAVGSIKALKNNIKYQTPEIFEKFINGQLNGSNTPQKKDESDMTFDNTQIYENFIQSLKNEINQLSNEKNHLSSQLQKSFDDFRAIKEEMTSQLNKITAEKADIQAEIEKIMLEKENLSDRLNEIYSSTFWKLAVKYYSFKDKAPAVKYIIELLKSFKRVGFNKSIDKVTKNFRTGTKKIPYGNKYENELNNLISNYRKAVIIPCAFEFNELYNQRPINMAKYFSEKGYFVLYIAWEWRHNEINRKGLVYKNLYQLPLYDFLDYGNQIEINHLDNATYLINLPSKKLVELSYFFRKKGFAIAYDIMDDWEEFYNSGNAPWYDKDYEEHAILISDVVTAVSQPLIDKFNFIRKDLALIGNGYTPEVLGLDNRYIALENKTNEKTIGYFGHLEESWFDWNLLIIAASKHPDLYFEIIGYGEPLWVREKMEELSNVKLIGKIHPSKLYNYVKRWKAAIIPFKTSILSKAVDPIKIYEYIYFGLPTVVTGIEHLDSYPNTFVVKDKNIFEETILSVLDSNKAKEADDFLTQSTWLARFQDFEKLILEANSYQGLYK